MYIIYWKPIWRLDLFICVENKGNTDLQNDSSAKEGRTWRNPVYLYLIMSPSSLSLPFIRHNSSRHCVWIRFNYYSNICLTYSHHHKYCMLHTKSKSCQCSYSKCRKSWPIWCTNLLGIYNASRLLGQTVYHKFLYIHTIRLLFSWVFLKYTTQHLKISFQNWAL